MTNRAWRYLLTPDEGAVQLIMGEGPATSTAAEEKWQVATIPSATRFVSIICKEMEHGNGFGHP